MTRDDIISMAREAGLSGLESSGIFDNFERFSALVAATEREACARLVEPSDEHRRDAAWGYLGGDEGVEMLDGIAAAIRARGTK
jgi:hypothetical protein